MVSIALRVLNQLNTERRCQNHHLTQTKMTTLDDLQKINEYDSAYAYRNHGGESLLEKYKIPIHHFDFDYVAKAKDSSELEKMVDVLRSGQEGYYPDLLRATEEQLRSLKPNSKSLRRISQVLNKQDLKKEEIDQISNDLQGWVTDVSKKCRELDERKTNKIRCDVKVRQCKPQLEPLNLVKNKDEKRISSTDYRAWDKYDPDTEIMKQDLEEEKMRRDAEKAQKAAENLKKEAERFACAGTSNQSHFVMGELSNANKQKLKKTVSFNQHSTEAEAFFISERELEKGREFFRSGDYELALKCFTQSIMNKTNVINLSNRALTYLKLQKFEEALQDCERVLVLDGKNLKILLRKAQALEGLKKYEEALYCTEMVIEKDPNNGIAQELAERVRQFCRNVLKNTKIKIVEIH